MKAFNELYTEAKEKELYFKTYSDALSFAYDYAVAEGYEVDADSWFSNVNTGPKRPSSNKTNSLHVELIKNKKPAKKKLHIQVYNRDMGKNIYELTKYIS